MTFFRPCFEDALSTVISEGVGIEIEEGVADPYDLFEEEKKIIYLLNESYIKDHDLSFFKALVTLGFPIEKDIIK